MYTNAALLPGGKNTVFPAFRPDSPQNLRLDVNVPTAEFWRFFRLLSEFFRFRLLRRIPEHVGNDTKNNNGLGGKKISVPTGLTLFLGGFGAC